MDKKIFRQVCQKIYQRFPMVKDKKPKITQLSEGRFLLIFSNSNQTPDGKIIQHTVRSVVTEEGKIIKASISR